MQRGVYTAALGAAALIGSVAALATVARAIPPGDIVLGDIVVFRLRTPSGKLTAQQRADIVQDRINEALAIPDVKEKDVCVRSTNYGPTIYVRDIKLLTVDPADAKLAGMDPLALAKLWAHRLMGVLPQVNIRLPSGGPPPPVSAATPDTGTAPAPAPAAPPAAPPAPAPTPTPTPAPPAAPAPNP